MSATDNSCGFRGDPLCEPNNCGGACDDPDLRAERPWRTRAYHQGIGGISDQNVAEMLLNLAERDEITVTHGVVAVLVEAAARVDGDAYLTWIKRLDDAEAVNSVPCLTFS